MSVQLQQTFAGIQRRLLERWGQNALRLAFLTLRDCVTHDEFRRGLASLGVRIADEDADLMAAKVESDRLTMLVVGSLPARRRTVVEEAFRKLCRLSGETNIAVGAIHEYFDPTRFQEVVSRLRTAEECVEEIAEAFNYDTNPDGSVGLEEFAAYYSGVSASIKEDSDFERYVLRSWNLDRPLAATREELATTMTRIPQSKEGRSHPLYQPSSTNVGKNLDQAFEVTKQFNRAGAFTKHAPPPGPSSGLNTSFTRSKAI